MLPSRACRHAIKIPKATVPVDLDATRLALGLSRHVDTYTLEKRDRQRERQTERESRDGIVEEHAPSMFTTVYIYTVRENE